MRHRQELLDRISCDLYDRTRQELRDRIVVETPDFPLAPPTVTYTFVYNGNRLVYGGDPFVYTK